MYWTGDKLTDLIHHQAQIYPEPSLPPPMQATPTTSRLNNSCLIPTLREQVTVAVKNDKLLGY
jgi:hypothetical protein